MWVVYYVFEGYSESKIWEILNRFDTIKSMSKFF